MIAVRWLDKNEIQDILPFLRMLNPKLDDEILNERIRSMQSDNYRCAAVFEQNQIIAISGVWTLYKHYIGKHIEPDHVIVDPAYRGNKIGETLMLWIHEQAQQESCITSELNCYVKNKEGQLFWEKLGYYPIGIHYQKRLR
jgi:GNAT superfamily N-acetyltransferase